MIKVISVFILWQVLMNLTNDNPVGCQQIAACGGLDTMVSLIVQHIPSFDLCFPENCQFKETISVCQSKPSSQNIKTSHVNNRHLSDHELDFLVAILGLLVNLVEKDGQNRYFCSHVYLAASLENSFSFLIKFAIF